MSLAFAQQVYARSNIRMNQKVEEITTNIAKDLKSEETVLHIEPKPPLVGA